MYNIPQAFKDFISPTCDRARFIQNYLKQGGIESSILQLEGKKHICVHFPKNQYNPIFRIKTVIAHYDRIGIGANDNSAAVFCLMEWARSMVVSTSSTTTGFNSTTTGFNSTTTGFRSTTTNAQHNIRLIFTDGEELGETGGVAQQGAFPLAQVFRRLGITNDDIYVFDCMGRGDVPVIARTSIPPNVSTKFLKAFSDLEQRAQRLLQSSAGGRWFTLPCSYSDNASFIANGIPAVAITMLPSAEVEAVVANGSCKTWELLHTSGDNLSSLTPQSFEIFHNILNNLASMKTVSL